MVTVDGDDSNKYAAQAPRQQEDILFQILNRLPAKSLMRFKLASKSWMALISDPFFINSHKHRSKKKKNQMIASRRNSSDPPEIITMKIDGNSVVLMDGKGRHKNCIPLFSTINFQFHRRPSIVHCDGLFLIGNTARRLLVCNPATRELVALPPTTFVPRESDSGVGIGLDPSTNKYKVVRISCRLEKYNLPPVCAAEVITLGAAGNSWRQMTCPQYHDISSGLAVATLQGEAYWMIKKNSHPSSRPNMAILRFNLSNEEFNVIDAPDPNKRLDLTELQGQLCCYGHADDIENPTIWVWLSNDNLAGWTLRYTIHLRDPIPPPCRFSFVPIAIDQKECLLFKFMLDMHCYNPRTNQYYMMGSDAYAPEITNSLWCHTTSYVETIMPISSDR